MERPLLNQNVIFGSPARPTSKPLLLVDCFPHVYLLCTPKRGSKSIGEMGQKIYRDEVMVLRGELNSSSSYILVINRANIQVS